MFPAHKPTKKMGWSVLDRLGHRVNFWNILKSISVCICTSSCSSKEPSHDQGSPCACRNWPRRVPDCAWCIPVFEGRQGHGDEEEGKDRTLSACFHFFHPGKWHQCSTKFPASIWVRSFALILALLKGVLFVSSGSSTKVVPRLWVFGTYFKLFQKSNIFLWAFVPAMKLEDLVAQHGFKQDRFFFVKLLENTASCLLLVLAGKLNQIVLPTSGFWSACEKGFFFHWDSTMQSSTGLIRFLNSKHWELQQSKKWFVASYLNPSAIRHVYVF